MRHLKTVYVLFFALLISPSAFAATLQIQPSGIVVTGLTPGARVAWFGVTIESLGYEVRSDRVAEITTADASGTATYRATAAVPVRSVWVAVDLATGGYVTGMPAGSPGTIRELDQRSFTAPGRLRQYLLPGRTFHELLLARPEKGAWTFSVGDGGASDEDGRIDGNIESSTIRFKPIDAGDGPSPERFQPTDTVVAIEAFKLEMVVARVAR